jgi:AraC-like DNA-binding protein
MNFKRMASFAILLVLWAVYAVFSTATIERPILNKENQISAFDDRESGGLSTSQISLKGTVLSVASKLMPAKKHPYAGFRMKLKSPKNLNGVSLNLNDTLKIRLQATLKNHQVHIYQFDKKYSDSSDIESYRIWSANLANKEGLVSIPMNKFQTPNWWRRSMSISLDEQDVRPQNISWISMTNSATTPIGVSDTLKIEAMWIKGDRSHGISSYLILILLLLFSVSFVLPGLKTKRKLALVQPNIRIRDNQDLEKEVTREYPAKLQSLLEILNTNLQTPEFSFEDLCKKSGLSKVKVNEILKEHLGETFKAVLSRIRLEKAGVMLKNTDLMISEIGYEVGYSQPAYFTRVFKQFYGTTPKQYRSGSKK